MRYVLYRPLALPDAPLRIGALHPNGESVADVSAVLHDMGGSAPISSMRVFLGLGAAACRAAAERALAEPHYHRPLAHVNLRAPIYDPEKLICVGMNYADHCYEQGLPLPVEPVIFSKFPTSISASGDPLVKPEEVAEFDYEVELAIVIGARGRRIKEADAMAHVAGFTVAHDVSARDWQLKKNGGQWLLGKCADGFAPLGPAIVTPDEVGDVHNLRLRCIVGGEVLQDGNTSQLVHNVPKCIAWISKFVTLNPGDVILTGTPPGVGCFRKPQRWLQVGESVTVEIEKLGSITNTVVADNTL